MAFVAGAAFGDTSKSRPPDVNRKFYADGRVHPFAGNTVICHLPQQGPASAAFDSMLDVYRDAPNYAFVRKVALLPPSSYHMTVFGGANDRPRSPKSWPSDLPLNMPLDSCTATLLERLTAAGIGCDLPIRMVADPDQGLADGEALKMLLLPADDTEKEKLRIVRREIARATRLPFGEPDNYRFHISIGYYLAWLTPEENREMKRALSGWAAMVTARAPTVELAAPEFCVFKDMYSFHRLVFLEKNRTL